MRKVFFICLFSVHLWAGWTIPPTETDPVFISSAPVTYVNTIGDTMTGNLDIANSGTVDGRDISKTVLDKNGGELTDYVIYVSTEPLELATQTTGYVVLSGITATPNVAVNAEGAYVSGSNFYYEVWTSSFAIYNIDDADSIKFHWNATGR